MTETEVPADVLKTLDGKTYTRLAMNYLIPVGKQGESHNIDVAATFRANNGEEVTVSAPNAPVQNNYRTNILGNLLTSQIIFNVEIVPIFNEPDNDIDIVNVKDEASLRALFATGGEAKLVADLVLDKTVAVETGKEVVLDLNGKTISNTEDLWNEATYNWSLLSVRGGALTLTGDGVVKAKEDDVFAVDVQDGGKLVIEGGEYVGNMDAVYAYEGTVEINGGKFSIQQLSENPDPYGYVLNCYDKNRENGIAKIIVSGGEFVKFNPADCSAEGAHTNFLAPGYKSTKIGDSYFVTNDGVTPVADNEGFQAAIGNAASGETIVLTAPLTLTSTTIVSDKEVNINLADNTLVLNKNVYTATSDQEAYNSEATGTITFKNGTIECAGTYSLCPFGKGKIELDNVTLTSANDSPLFVKHGSTLIVKNSKINAKYYGITTNASNPNQNVTIVVDNCVITAGEPILVNIPCNLTVTKSTMNGSWHGTVVRGGTATFTDSKIVLNYVDSDAADVAANYNWMGATWGSGNSITIAALVIGNHAPSAYQYPTNVTLKNTTVACEGVNASLFPSVYSYANQGEGLGVTFNYDADSNLESGKGPVYNSSNIVVNGVEI